MTICKYVYVSRTLKKIMNDNNENFLSCKATPIMSRDILISINIIAFLYLFMYLLITLHTQIFSYNT